MPHATLARRSMGQSYFRRLSAPLIGAMKKCLDCEQELDDEEFYRDKSRPDGREPYCKECKGIRRRGSLSSPQQRAARKAYRQDNQDRVREWNRNWSRKRSRKLKLELIALLGGKCQQCGFNDHPAALQFHHRDPLTKSFNIMNSARMSKKYPWDVVLAEVEKCDLLCANCHAIVECLWDD